MKKTVILSLVAALSLTSSSVVAQAKPLEPADNQTVNVQAVKADSVPVLYSVKLLPTEITGVIEDISELEMKVKVKAGEIYVVPLGLFSKQEDFKALGLAKGVEVTLKSLKPDISGTSELKTSAGLALEIEGKDIKSTDIIESTDAAQAVVAIEAAGVVDMGKLVKVFPEPEDGQKLEGGNVIFSVESADGKEPELKKITIGEGEQFFVATEITANGKTAKLEKSNTVMITKNIISAMPAELSGTVQSIDGTEMVVKTKDEKVYTIPLAEFIKKDEFKGLDIKSGTEVILKSSPLKKVVTITGSITEPSIKTAGSGEEKIIVSKSEIKDFPEGKLMFIADEITANGKTVKLSK
ncbi:MAG: hypothetical protein K0R50_3277 [Eubacterium sp.]|jgi:hypothetical protein|nr:hypothetical protein [Eubacterium sp.]